MHHIALAEGADLSGFKMAARKLIARNVPPRDIIWSSGDAPMLFSNGELHSDPASDAPPLCIPRAAGALIEAAVCHREPERYALLYELIWRLLHGERALLDVATDPLMHRLEMMRKAVARDIHKMHAFLRFKPVKEENGEERMVAWFEPAHFILEVSARFFTERFRSFKWSILTPVGSLHWDGAMLEMGPPAASGATPDDDDFEAAWRCYYESIFNPARLNLKAMAREMPKKYWHNMPETQAIPALIAAAESRVAHMVAEPGGDAPQRAPAAALARMNAEPETLEALNAIIRAAEPMVQGGTRAVLGEGPLDADIAFVGEQPGDQEDLRGRPFVGPAGQLFDQALQEAGIDRKAAYVTNAVKHFKYEQRGKKRLHKSPTAGEIAHYRWWLLKELDLVRPKLIVALGASAALALGGKAVSVTHARGPVQFGGKDGFLTVHPSYLLRIPDGLAKQQAYEAFRGDLKAIRQMSA